MLEEDDSVGLAEDEAHTYVSDKLVNYTSFKLDVVVLLYKPNPENRIFEPEERNDLLAHVRSERERALTKDDACTVVTEPAEGVARV